MKGYFRKFGFTLVPDNDKTSEWLAKKKEHAVIEVEAVEPRSYPFLKKYFALLNHAYECWVPPEKEYKGMPVQKNFERFRNDVQILAGYGYPVTNIRGEVRYESRSISFSNMSVEDFEKLYSKVVDVILHYILTNYTREDLDSVVEKTINFL